MNLSSSCLSLWVNSDDRPAPLGPACDLLLMQVSTINTVGVLWNVDRVQPWVDLARCLLLDGNKNRRYVFLRFIGGRKISKFLDVSDYGISVIKLMGPSHLVWLCVVCGYF